MVFIIAASVVICLAIAFFMGIAAGQKLPDDSAWQSFSAGDSAPADTDDAGHLPAISAIPLIIYGHQIIDRARSMAIATGRDCISVKDLKTLQILLRDRWFMGIIAKADSNNPAEAGKAIRLFRKHYPDAGIALYAAWDRVVEQPAQQALDCQADGLIMPDLDETGIVTYLNAVIERIERDEPRPATAAEHRDLYASLLPPYPALESRIITQSIV